MAHAVEPGDTMASLLFHRDVVPGSTVAGQVLQGALPNLPGRRVELVNPAGHVWEGQDGQPAAVVGERSVFTGLPTTIQAIFQPVARSNQ